ncbi:MAG: WbqC family protein [Trichodesmium sp. MAG_R04]|nr:WbqC family protein [Trichodesmium sp. MAG_R04]
MKVGIIQSSYIPWRGYFDFINSVDSFIIYDDVLFSKGSWRNRNQVKTRSGLTWISVPVNSKLELPIDRVLICKNIPWRRKHRGLLKDSLQSAPFFKDAICLWEECVNGSETTISELNIKLIKTICAYLNIATPILMSRDYQVKGSKTERLIQLLKKSGATTYLSGPTAKGYLDEKLFREHKIRLEYKTYDYDPYPQLFGNFIGTVTVLDTIANTGKDAIESLTSKTPSIIAVE